MSDTLLLSHPVIDADSVAGDFLDVARDLESLLSLDQDSLSDAITAVSGKIDTLLGDHPPAISSLSEISSLPPGLRSAIAVIRGPEDTLPPEKKVNRAALLKISASPASVANSYSLLDCLPEIRRISDALAVRVLELLSIFNNYASYINVRGVLARKQALLDRSVHDHQPAREQRFAATVMQIFDTLMAHRQHDIPMNGKDPFEYKINSYRRALRTLSDFLKDTDSFSSHQEMAQFSLGDVDLHQMHDLHTPLQRVVPLSSHRAEFTFIIIHQIFEAMFEDALRILREISVSSPESVQIQQISDVSAVLRAAREFYVIMIGLLDKDDFLNMRGSLGIASGAQSEQYHQIERQIGMPHGASFAHTRHTQVGHIVGPHSSHHLANEAQKTGSLQENLSPTSQAMGDALRGLNIDVMALKVGHATMMLHYLPPHIMGTAGTRITHYFSSVLGGIFPVFTEQELGDMHEAARAAMHIDSTQPDMSTDQDQSSDKFRAIKKYLDGLPRAMPPELIRMEPSVLKVA